MMFDVGSKKMFLDVESLIAWFEAQEGELKYLGQYAAYTLRELAKKAVNKPNRVMTEETFRAENKIDEH